MKYKHSSRERCFLLWFYFLALHCLWYLHSYFCHYLKNFSFFFFFPREKLHIIVSWFPKTLHIYILKFATLPTRISLESTRYDPYWIWRQLVYGFQKGSRIKHQKLTLSESPLCFLSGQSLIKQKSWLHPRKYIAPNISIACFFLVIIITSINTYWALLWT